MSSLDVKLKGNNFLFFGCWNNINCDNDKFIYRDIVLYSIKKLESKDTDTLFIAGDNWYNFLIKNNEDLKNIIVNEDNNITDDELYHYLTPILISGYYLLYDMKKNVYLCAGNHDEAKDSQDEKKFIFPKKDNCMIKTQKYYINDIKKNSNASDGSLDYIKDAPSNIGNKYLENPIFKFISEVSTKNDTEKLNLNNIDNLLATINDDKKDNEIILFSDKNNIEIREFENYIMIIINTNYLDSNYILKISNIINNFKGINKKIFVMGHFPLFFIKKKDNNILQQNNELTPELIDELYKILVMNNCIYLCADTHNFNIMRICKKIDDVSYYLIQIMAGTGGADPDLITEIVPKLNLINKQTSSKGPSKGSKDSSSEENNILLKQKINDYEIEYNTINSYGYCRFIVEKEKICLIYYKIINAENNIKWMTMSDISEVILDSITAYKYNIVDNDVCFYKKLSDIVYDVELNDTTDDKSLFKSNTSIIKDIVESSLKYKDIYCNPDYMNMNHVIKNNEVDKDKIKICYNKAYKIKKNKINKAK